MVLSTVEVSSSTGQGGGNVMLGPNLIQQYITPNYVHELSSEEIELEEDSGEQVDEVASSSSSIMRQVTSDYNFKGQYEFDVEFSDSQQYKTVSYLYETHEDKIYVKQQSYCPFKFLVNTLPPEETIIRAKLIYTSPEFASTPVKRCPLHAAPHDPSNNNFSYPFHLLRSESSNATYETDADGQMSVLVPYVAPQIGTGLTISLYKFMCLSSCAGGINRRALKLVFSLEHKMKILGQRAFHIRICACPKRDKMNDGKKMKRKAPSEDPSPEFKRTKTPENVFNLAIGNLEDFVLLKRIRDSLEFQRKYNKNDES